MNLFNKLAIIIGMAAFLSLFSWSFSNVDADTSLNSIGDIGCKSVAKSNLKNLADAKVPLLTVGDIRYDCSISSIKPLWDNIAVKHGTYGNHDVESASSKAFVKATMGLGDKGWFSWKLNDIAMIGINQYTDWKKGSEQYNYVVSKTAQFDGRDDINWIIYSFHEPTYTPTYKGGHGPAKEFRSIYDPIFKSNPNVLIVEAHNHGTAWGTVNDMHFALCGGGGQGGDEFTGSLNGFAWATSKTSEFGYCQFNFQKDKIDVSLIGADKTVKASHVFTK